MTAAREDVVPQAPSQANRPRVARPKVVLVAGVARDCTIGLAGSIPWRFPDDMKAFKRITMGTALVMGRKTYDSIGKPLPGRDNIVITRRPAEFAAAHPGTFPVASLDEALTLAASRGATVASVIGGGEIYTAALPIADEMVLTQIPHEGGGDVFFPRWHPEDWDEVSRVVAGQVVVVRLVRLRR
ncbi:MAG: dihydrofolate reductase [Planctomycetes bacterium]|nr:dihydrofolate reductase [Planctomycetota bacterium]